MANVKELTDNIFKMTVTVKEKFPELSNYLDEMPDTNEATSSMNLITLNNYYDSLVALSEHSETAQINEY